MGGPRLYPSVLTCDHCGREYRRKERGKPSPRHFCSRECAAQGHTGAQSPKWRGGRVISSTGYVKLKMPEHPAADPNGYVYEHRIVAERMLGRPLLSTEIVHHRNGNKQDNREENLLVTDGISEHKTHHRRAGSRLQVPGEPNPVVACACGCGGEFARFDESGRPRRYLPGHYHGGPRSTPRDVLGIAPGDMLCNCRP